jgi:hypothetical protein
MFSNYDSLFNSMFDFNSLFNFNPFNLFSHKKTAAPTTVTGTDVNIGVNQSYNVKINGLSIHGNKSSEKVTVAQNISGIKIDSAVESVTLSGIKFDSNALVSAQDTLTIAKVATLSVAANHNEALNFANAVGTLSLDSLGNGIFNLSEIQLDKNQNFIVTNNDLQVYGNSGQEKITLAHGVTGVEVSSTVETVVLDGNSSNYFYDIQGGTVVVSDNSGNDVAFIDVNQSATGSQIQFADKTLSASWEITSSFGRWNSWGVTVTDPTAPVTPTIISGGTNLPYSVDFSKANLGSNLANVEANVKIALENIGKYIGSKTPFNLQVLTEQTSPKTLAETNATMISSNNSNGVTQTTTTFLADSVSGINSNGATPDATLYINLANLNQMSFSGVPVADKYDLTSILTHEILHGLAFTGNLGTSAGLKTPYDALVSIQNNLPVFTGTHTEAVNGNNPVALDSASAGDGSAYYHVAIADDLMADSLAKGEVRTISPLDIAMLQDMGVMIIGVQTV